MTTFDISTSLESLYDLTEKDSDKEMKEDVEEPEDERSKMTVPKEEE